MATIAVTGSAGGIGKATRARLEAGGHRVVGVDDARDVDLAADPGDVDHRERAVLEARVGAARGGRGRGPFPCAGTARRRRGPGGARRAGRGGRSGIGDVRGRNLRGHVCRRARSLRRRACGRRFGFRRVGLLPGVAYRHGRWADTVMVQRSLAAGSTEPPLISRFGR